MNSDQNILSYASRGDPLRDVPCRFRVDLTPPPAWPELLMLIFAMLATALASVMTLGIVVAKAFSGQTIGAALALLIAAPVSAALLLVAWSLFRETVRLARHGGRRITLAITDDQLIIHNPAAWNAPLRSWPRRDVLTVDVDYLGLNMILQRSFEMRIHCRSMLEDVEVQFIGPTQAFGAGLKDRLSEHLSIRATR